MTLPDTLPAPSPRLRVTEEPEMTPANDSVLVSMVVPDESSWLPVKLPWTALPMTVHTRRAAELPG